MFIIMCKIVLVYMYIDLQFPVDEPYAPADEPPAMFDGANGIQENDFSK